MRDSKKIDYGHGSSRKLFRYTASQLSKHLAQSCKKLAEDESLDASTRELYLKKSIQLERFKASRSTMARWESGAESRVNAEIDHVKTSAVSQVRAKKGNPLYQELFTRSQLEFYEKLYLEGKLKGMRPEADQISNSDEIGISDNGEIQEVSKIVFNDPEMNDESNSKHRRTVVLNEHNGFWNSIFFGTNALGKVKDENNKTIPIGTLRIKMKDLIITAMIMMNLMKILLMKKKCQNLMKKVHQNLMMMKKMMKQMIMNNMMKKDNQMI